MDNDFPFVGFRKNDAQPRYIGKRINLYQGLRYDSDLLITERSAESERCGRRRSFDKWLPVCEYCPLPDCIRQEGDYRGNVRQATRTYWDCPIFEAQENSWSVQETLTRLNGKSP